jgi:hypothetical protein
MKGRGFTSRKHAGGWIGIAAMVVGGIASSAASQSSQSRQDKMKYSDSKDLSNLGFEQQSWLAQQQHKWELEDFQMQHNYNKGLIHTFDSSAPANVLTADGSWPAAAPNVDVSQQTQGLAQTDANGQPLIYDPRTGAPVFANSQVPVAPAKTAPMGQFG